MKQMAIDLANKYDFSSILSRLKELDELPSIKIGFIGEFSAGKSSLINSILDIHLPTSIKPTTKAICLIEPTPGIERNEFFHEINGVRHPVAFREFSEILKGEKEDVVAAIKVKPCAVLPPGCIFVDTPGVHTVTGNEADLTYGYLAMLDAAVVCVNITDGIINKNLLDFIRSSQLHHLHKHMVFALTWADRKTDDECEIIRQAIVKLLQKEINEGRFKSDHIDRKVFPVSSVQGNNAEKVYTFLKETVLDDLPELCCQRQQTECKIIVNDLLALLEERLKVSSYDDSEIAAEKKSIQKKEDELNRECEKHVEKKEKFEQNLRSKIASVMQSHSYAINTASSEEAVSEAVNAMNQDIVQMLNSEAERYLGISEFNDSVVGNIGMEIHNRIKTIEGIKNLSVTVGTAVATAWILPGGSTAANAGEAAAGAATKGAATGAATAAAKAGVGSRILKGIGMALKDINPLEHVGTFVAGFAKNKSMETLMENKANEILNNVIISLEGPFEDQVIRPIREKIEENRRMLDELTEKEDIAYAAYKEQKKELVEEINKLKTMVAL